MSFEIPSVLNYSPPVPTIENSVNFVSFKPISGSTFSPNDNIKFKITSNNSFLRPSKCFLKYDLALTGGTPHASGSVSVLGGSSVLQRIESVVSGLRVEDIDDYNLMVSKLYQKSTEEYKELLKTLEGYNDTTNSTFVRTTADPRPARTVCHALRTCLFEAPTDIPLCFLRGGVELNLFTSPFKAYYSTNGTTPATSYTISNVSMVVAFVKVPDSYLSSFQSSLERGNKASIPLKITRHIQSQVTASSENHIQLNVGFLKSLTSIMGVIRKSAEILTDTKDNFALNTRDGLESYFLTNGTDRIPLDHNVECGLTNFNPTSLMMELCSIDNTYNHFGTTYSGYTGDTEFEIFQNLSPHPGSFGSGMSITDGTIIENLYFATSKPTAASRVDWYINYDALLKISNEGVVLDSSNF